jgi:hypothetical protein
MPNEINPSSSDAEIIGVDDSISFTNEDDHDSQSQEEELETQGQDEELETQSKGEENVVQDEELESQYEDIASQDEDHESRDEELNDVDMENDHNNQLFISEIIESESEVDSPQNEYINETIQENSHKQALEQSDSFADNSASKHLNQEKEVSPISKVDSHDKKHVENKLKTDLEIDHENVPNKTSIEAVKVDQNEMDEYINQDFLKKSFPVPQKVDSSDLSFIQETPSKPGNTSFSTLLTSTTKPKDFKSPYANLTPKIEKSREMMLFESGTPDQKLEKQIIELKEQIILMKAENTKQNLAAQSLETQVSVLNAEIQKRDEEIFKFQSSHKANIYENQKNMFEKEQLTSSLIAKQQEVGRLLQDLESANNEINNLKVELRSEKTKSSDIQVEKFSSQSGMVSLQQELSQFQKMVDWLNQELQQKSQQHQEYRTEKVFRFLTLEQYDFKITKRYRKFG